MPRILLDGLRKEYEAGTVAVHGLDLEIRAGERVVLVGPSGSGKSTVLRLVAGLEAPTAGRVWIGDRDVTAEPPERRDLAMVFQNYALYPHRTVRENLAFGLRMRRVAPDEIVRRVAATAETLGLTSLLDRRPAALSGGQRQRVALGRAIVREPRAFLFDEPLSNLDPRLRGDARAELLTLHARLATTFVYVTHDQEEAMTIGERIAVLRDGRLEQVAEPMTIYRSPANVFVAGFIGSPPMNLVKGRVASVDGRLWFEHGGRRLWTLSPGTVDAVPARADMAIGVRPQDLDVSAEHGGEDAVGGRVAVVEPLGHLQIVHVDAGDVGRLTTVLSVERRLSVGDTVWVRPAAGRIHLFDGEGNAVARAGA